MFCMHRHQRCKLKTRPRQSKHAFLVLTIDRSFLGEFSFLSLRNGQTRQNNPSSRMQTSKYVLFVLLSSQRPGRILITNHLHIILSLSFLFGTLLTSAMSKTSQQLTKESSICKTKNPHKKMAYHCYIQVDVFLSRKTW